MSQSEKLHNAFVPKSNNKATKEILYDGYLYDVTKFLHRHPGGHKILLNFTETGEDASLAIQQFHSRSIEKVLKMMKTLPRRSAPHIEFSEEAEQNKQRNAAMTADFVNLYKEFLEEKLFEPSICHWIYRIVEWIALGLLGFSLLTESSHLFGRLSGSFFLAFAMGRGLWMMHEFGHISATASPTLDRILHDIIIGISMGHSGTWWRRDHSLHHAMTNRVVKDPAMHPLPGLITFNVKSLKNPEKDQTFFERNQMYFLPFYPVLFYFRWSSESFYYLYRKRKITELISVSFHYAMMYQIGWQMWLLTATLFSYYVMFHLFLSHSFVPVTAKPTHWVEQSLTGTVNVTSGYGRWVDWWMGYLNYQIEHHLFPTLPEVKIPLIVDRVKELAEKHGLPYHVYSYGLTTRKAFVNLERVADTLKRMG